MVQHVANMHMAGNTNLVELISQLLLKFGVY